MCLFFNSKCFPKLSDKLLIIFIRKDIKVKYISFIMYFLYSMLLVATITGEHPSLVWVQIIVSHQHNPSVFAINQLVVCVFVVFGLEKHFCKANRIISADKILKIFRLRRAIFVPGFLYKINYGDKNH